MNFNNSTLATSRLRFAASFLLATGLLPSLLTPCLRPIHRDEFGFQSKRHWNEPGGSGFGQRLGHHLVGDEPVLGG